MAKDTFYEVEAGRFQITVTEVSPEDATGDLFTSEELFEAHGHRYGGTHFRTELIEGLIATYVIKAKARGTKTIVIDDVEFVDFLKEQAQRGYNMDHFSSETDHVRRVDNRLFLQDGKAKAASLTPKKTDLGKLVQFVVASLHFDVGCEMNITYYASDRMGTILMLKKMTTWENLLAYNELTKEFNKTAQYKRNERSEEELALIKQMWDNPEIFGKKPVEGEAEED